MPAPFTIHLLQYGRNQDGTAYHRAADGRAFTGSPQFREPPVDLVYRHTDQAPWEIIGTITRWWTVPSDVNPDAGSAYAEGLLDDDGELGAEITRRLEGGAAGHVSIEAQVLTSVVTYREPEVEFIGQPCECCKAMNQAVEPGDDCDCPPAECECDCEREVVQVTLDHEDLLTDVEEYVVLTVALEPTPAFGDARIVLGDTPPLPGSGVVTAEGEATDPVNETPPRPGAMIAFDIDPLSIPCHIAHDVPAHMTLFYYGPADEADHDEMTRDLAAFTEGFPQGPVEFTISGVTVLGPKDGLYAVALIANPPAMIADRVEKVWGERRRAAGNRYTAWLPHVTVAYDLPRDDAYQMAATIDTDGRALVTRVACAHHGANATCIAFWQSGLTASAVPTEKPPRVIIASADIPVTPPAEWFTRPEPAGATPVTVTPDGSFFGHVALWGTCHQGFPDECVTAPSSRTGYGHYHLGAVKTALGGEVPVGQITLGCGHASVHAGWDAASHYDNTGTAVADVHVINGKLGVWACGALRPGTTDEQIRELLGAKLSGDWRDDELVAVLAVNVPGFIVPRARIAGGTRTAIVAAGVVQIRPPAPPRNLVTVQSGGEIRLTDSDDHGVMVTAGTAITIGFRPMATDIANAGFGAFARTARGSTVEGTR